MSQAMRIPDLLDEKAGLHPDKAFVVFEGADGAQDTVTYAQFKHRADRLAAGLAEAGVRPGQNVALMMGNCIEFLIAWVAINRVGAVMVSVNVFYSQDELQYLLNHSESVGFITEPKFVPLFDAIAAECPSVKVRICGRTEQEVPGFRLLTDVTAEGPPANSDEPMAQIVYTSGTTSRPKGVLISHRSSILQGHAVAEALGMVESDRTCVVLPLFHVNAQYIGVLSTLVAGGTMVLIESYSATRFWQQVRGHRCSLISIVPMQLRTMLAQPERAGDCDHAVRVAFYALPTKDSEWDAFEQRFGVHLVEGYGLTETLGICTCNPLSPADLRRHSIGRTMPGRDIRLLDDAGKEQPQGEIGRITVRGGALFSGYFRDPESTAKALSDGWLDTGDNGYFDADGFLHFFDRGKDIIKRAGENVAASEVERTLNDHPAVMESAVIAVPDELRDEAVKAFVVLAENASADQAELQDWCAARLAKFKVPSEIEFLPALPKTSIGKIQKFMLKQGTAHAS